MYKRSRESRNGTGNMDMMAVYMFVRFCLDTLYLWPNQGQLLGI